MVGVHRKEEDARRAAGWLRADSGAERRSGSADSGVGGAPPLVHAYGVGDAASRAWCDGGASGYGGAQGHASVPSAAGGWGQSHPERHVYGGLAPAALDPQTQLTHQHSWVGSATDGELSGVEFAVPASYVASGAIVSPQHASADPVWDVHVAPNGDQHQQHGWWSMDSTSTGYWGPNPNVMSGYSSGTGAGRDFVPSVHPNGGAMAMLQSAGIFSRAPSGRYSGMSPMGLKENKCNKELFKTELCNSYMDTGTCRYGVHCQFAHGSAELRPVQRHPKYKTKLCKNFSETGSCPYGNRCRFIHDDTAVAPQAYMLGMLPRQGSASALDHAVLTLQNIALSDPSTAFESDLLLCDRDNVADAAVDTAAATALVVANEGMCTPPSMSSPGVEAAALPRASAKPAVGASSSAASAIPAVIAPLSPDDVHGRARLPCFVGLETSSDEGDEGDDDVAVSTGRGSEKENSSGDENGTPAVSSVVDSFTSCGSALQLAAARDTAEVGADRASEQV